MTGNLVGSEDVPHIVEIELKTFEVKIDLKVVGVEKKRVRKQG